MENKKSKPKVRTVYEYLDGQDIKEISTFRSWYDNNCIQLSFSGGQGSKSYRLDVSKLLPLLHQVTFKAEKKRVHTYLTPDCLIVPDERVNEINEDFLLKI